MLDFCRIQKNNFQLPAKNQCFLVPITTSASAALKCLRPRTVTADGLGVGGWVGWSQGEAEANKLIYPSMFDQMGYEPVPADGRDD